MLKFQLKIDSANAEFKEVRDSLDAVTRITQKIAEYSAAQKIAEYSAALERGGALDADTLAWTDAVKDINGNKVGFFTLLWESDESAALGEDE